ncbi:MAG: hypothetical protein IH959_01555 [Chloroflexi bacterium]|nr:hypothetical protein [Chloroflexota bacterium]
MAGWFRNRWALIVSLALAVLAPFAVACGNGGDEAPEELVIPHSVIEALDNYAFTTDLDISSAQGDLQASFDGVFEAPDKFQGKLRTSGQLALGFGRPAETEVIAIGDRVWWREPNGAWQPGIRPDELGEGSIDPFLLFSMFATPRFYLESLDFDSLRLSTSGSVETLNGMRAYPVRLDKAALIGMLDQGTFTKEAGKDVSIVREDAKAFLPEDIIIETWIAEDGRYPVRLVVTLSSDESDGFSFFFEKPLDIRLQMDITDPDADVEIEPPEEGGS